MKIRSSLLFRILFSTLVLTPIANADPGPDHRSSDHRPFDGFYLGGQVGGTQHQVQTDFPSITWTVNVKDSAVKRTNKTHDWIYGLYAGYGRNLSGFYCGVEVNIDHDTARSEASYDIQTIKRGVVTGQYPTTLDTTYQRGVVFGLTPRLGVVIAQDHLIYVKCGIERSHDKAKAHHQWYEVDARGFRIEGTGASKTVSSSKTQYVFVPGIGYERALGRCLARIEYGYNPGATLKTQDLVTNAQTKQTPATVKYSAHIVKFGLAYQF